MRHGELVKVAREKRRWSRSVLARESGVDRGLICRIEDGALSGSVETLVRLATALDINLNLLKPDPLSEADTEHWSPLTPVDVRDEPTPV